MKYIVNNSLAGTHFVLNSAKITQNCIKNTILNLTLCNRAKNLITTDRNMHLLNLWCKNYISSYSGYGDMENFDNFGEFPIVLGVNGVRFPKKFTPVIFIPKCNTKKKLGVIGQCRGNNLILPYIFVASV